MPPTLCLLITLLLLVPSALRAGNGHPFGERNKPTVPGVPVDDLTIEPVPLETLPRKRFKVGHVGEIGQPKREVLVALFAAFQAQYALDDSAHIVPAAPWNGTTLAIVSATLQQDSVEGLYLLGASSGHSIVFKPASDAPLAVGTKLKVFAFLDGEQPWITPDGGPQKSPFYREVSLPPKGTTPHPPTRDQFIAALRAGHKFEVLVKDADALVVQTVEW